MGNRWGYYIVNSPGGNLLLTFSLAIILGRNHLHSPWGVTQFYNSFCNKPVSFNFDELVYRLTLIIKTMALVLHQESSSHIFLQIVLFGHN